MIHDLKILPEHFVPIVTSDKKAEVRFNDRGFKADDYLRLCEWSEETGFTGKMVVRIVTHVADLSAWQKDWVLLSMRELG